MDPMDGSASAGSADFYDGLAPVYDRLYPDWGAACRDQGQVLHEIVSGRLGSGPLQILDAAVGIGTQLIGLAAHGHLLCGTDLSPSAVRRAREECTERQADARVAVADLRELPFADAVFDAAVCADNAVAHLMSATELTRALREMARVTRPGGLVIVSTRDYEMARREHPPGTLPQVWRGGGEETISLQVWDWREDGERYDLQHFQITGAGGEWQVTRRTTTLWAVTQAELMTCAERAGLVGSSWLDPEESGYFQPLLVASVRDGADRCRADGGG